MANRREFADHLLTTLPHLYLQEDTPAQMERMRQSGLARFTYFASGDWTGLIKIGSARNPISRVKGLTGARHGQQATILVTLRGDDLELCYHNAFSEHRVKGEWFSPDQRIIAEIEAIKAYRDARGEPHILTFERI